MKMGILEECEEIGSSDSEQCLETSHSFFNFALSSPNAWNEKGELGVGAQ